MKYLNFVICARSSVSFLDPFENFDDQIGHEYVISGERKAANIELLIS